MPAQTGPEEETKRTALLKEFRELLVERFSEKTSMEVLLADAGLKASYIVDTSNVVERWALTLKSIERDSKLLSLLRAVREKYDEPITVVENLLVLEEINDKEKDELRRQAQAEGTFTRLIWSMRFTTDHVTRLRRAEHPNRTVLTQLKGRLHGLYKLFDELHATQRGSTAQSNEILQAEEIEKLTNRCSDALLYYMTLLEYARPADGPIQIETNEPPGRLTDRAKDESVLIDAKRKLHDALLRLGEQAAEFNIVSGPPGGQQ